MDLMLLYLALNQLVLTFAPAVSNYRTLKFNLTVTNNRNTTSTPSTVAVTVQPTTNSLPKGIRFHNTIRCTVLYFSLLITKSMKKLVTGKFIFSFLIRYSSTTL
jgi:hypothetical protein